ncbi:high light inducible protein [Synechococcus sp. GreenBA-s]|nr:high light inducible protein [Synechococcus sp. GreenBA-s]
MTSSPAVSPSASDSWFQAAATAQIHAEQLQRVELFNGRAAMLGFLIGVLTEALTGQGILHQIGLATLLGPGGGLG